MLARYETDFERDRPGLVGDAFRALWAARRGLSEPELLELLGDGVDPVPHAVWSPLVLAAEDGLVTRSGMLGFATDVHRRAVEDRYLATRGRPPGGSGGAGRATSASQPLGPRVVEELPWAQLAAGDLDGLVAHHLGPPLPRRRLPAGARRPAAAVGPGRGGRAGPVVDGYRPVLTDPAAHPEEAWAVARLVTDAGHPTEALGAQPVPRRPLPAGELPQRPRPRPGCAPRSSTSAPRCGSRASSTEAEVAARRGRRPEPGGRATTHLLQAALGNLGLVRARQRRAGRGDRRCSPRRPTCAAGPATRGDCRPASATTPAPCASRARTTEALALLTEQEALCRSIGEQAGLGAALVGQAAVLADQGDPAAALPRFEAYRAWAVEAGDLRAQAEAELNLGNTLRQMGRREEACRRTRAEAEAIVRRMGDGALLARVLDGEARIASDEGRWPDVDRLATEAVLTAKAADAPAVVVLALGSLGTARRELGDLPGSSAAHQEELAVATQLGDPAAVATAQVNLGNVCIAANDLAGGLGWYAAAEPALRERNSGMVLVPLLNNRWQVHNDAGRTTRSPSTTWSPAATQCVHERRLAAGPAGPDQGDPVPTAPAGRPRPGPVFADLASRLPRARRRRRPAAGARRPRPRC